MVAIPCDMDCVNSRSILSISAANRFKIRPVGVTSKNATGARSTRSDKSSCNFCDAFSRCIAMKIDRRVSPKTPMSPNMAYIPTKKFVSPLLNGSALWEAAKDCSAQCANQKPDPISLARPKAWTTNDRNATHNPPALA